MALLISILIAIALFWIGTAAAWFIIESRYARGHIRLRLWRAVTWLPAYVRNWFAR